MLYDEDIISAALASDQAEENHEIEEDEEESHTEVAQNAAEAYRFILACFEMSGRTNRRDAILSHSTRSKKCLDPSWEKEFKPKLILSLIVVLSDRHCAISTSVCMC